MIGKKNETDTIFYDMSSVYMGVSFSKTRFLNPWGEKENFFT